MISLHLQNVILCAWELSLITSLSVAVTVMKGVFKGIEASDIERLTRDQERFCSGE